MRTRKLALLGAVALMVPAACGGDDAGSAEPSVDDWCAAAGMVNDLSDALDDVDVFDPEAVEVAYQSFLTAVEDLREVAPSEIRDDIGVLAQGIGTANEALAAADYNLFDVDLAVISESLAQAEAAGDRVSDFNQRECGFDPREESTEPLDLGDDVRTGRDLMVAEFMESGFTEDEARCIADNIDLSRMGEDEMGAVFEVFDECGISTSRLAEIGG